MKKIFFRILAGLLLLFIVAAAVVYISLNSIVKKGVDTVGPKITKVETHLQGAKLSPLSGKGQLNGLFVGNPEGYKTPSAIEVGQVSVAVQPSSIFSDTILVESVNIQAPVITLEGSLTGNNLSKILDNLNSLSGTNQAAKTEPASKSEKKFVVKDLVMQGAKVNLSLAGLGGKSMTVPLPDIHLQDIGSKENGVTAGELARQILQPVLANTTKAATEAVTNVGKGVEEIGKGAVKELDKAKEGLKGLFK